MSELSIGDARQTERSRRGENCVYPCVDDDQFANTLVQFVLIKEGYEVETADNHVELCR